MDPGIALMYRSTNGNGWVGVGWELEVGAIERNTKNGVNYSGSDYVLRMAGAAVDLVSIGGNEYRAKIEGAFYRVQKTSDFWVVTDKAGVKYIFGNADASRQNDPLNAANVFKWCLAVVQDSNGNTMTLSYAKPLLQLQSPYTYDGQIYLDRIDYTGNSTQHIAPTNFVRFYRENRDDVEVSYTPNFIVETSQRLKAIEVVANGNHVRSYDLVYDADPNTSGSQYSGNTGRSLLQRVQQFDKNAFFDVGTGRIVGGSALPPMIFGWYANSSNFVGESLTALAAWDYVPGNTAVVTGDFDGDGKTDIAWRLSGSEHTGWQVAVSTGSVLNESQWTTPGTTWDWMDDNTAVVTGDFNGDGKTDIAWRRSGWSGWQVAISAGSGFTGGTWTDPCQWDYMDQNTRVVTGDFNGDGKTDIAWTRSGWSGWQVALSTGSSFTGGLWPTAALGNLFGDMSETTSLVTGDFDGDGKTDIAWRRSGWDSWAVARSTGSDFTGGLWTTPGAAWDVMDGTTVVVTGDFNGDGKTDIAWRRSQWTGWQVARSTGSGFAGGQWTSPGQWDLMDINTAVVTGDFNGDGKTDIAWRRSGWSGWQVDVSTGSSFTGGQWTTSANWDVMDQYGVALAGDFTGDGKTDIVWRRSGWPTWSLNVCTGDVSDSLSSVANGIGGLTAVTYEPSTLYVNTLLPFPVQTVSSVTAMDGNGISAMTAYTYSGGFFNIGDRDFRGFNYVKVTGPGDGIGERKVVETWFHQGNDTAVDANNPYATDGYMKGKPYRTKISDDANNIYSEVTTSYITDGSPPYFNPPLQIDAIKCDHGECGMHTKTILAYDSHGNLANEKQYDDSTLYRTTVRSFTTNETNWIVGLPLNETVYQGDETTGTQVANTISYYDGTTDCNVASTNTSPTQGNTTRIVRWYKEKQSGASDPEARMAYDGYGNLFCTQDAKGYGTTLSYDTTYTYPTVATNHLGYQMVTQYYGVDSVAADNGLYGQVKSVTDPNTAEAETQYDTFGRKIKTTMPDGTWQGWYYSPLGIVGAQYVKTYDINGIASWGYFDGMGRTFLGQKTGPGGRTISVRTEYNKTGTVKRTSLPYFEGTETPRYTTYTYDPIGRTTQVTNNDGTSMSACFYLDATVGLDADKHLKREKPHRGYMRRPARPGLGRRRCLLRLIDRAGIAL